MGQNIEVELGGELLKVQCENIGNHWLVNWLIDSSWNIFIEHLYSNQEAKH